MSDDIKTLGDELPKEIERCQELLEAYRALGPIGTFGYTMIIADINAAHKAMMDGDLPGMIRAYQALKRCK